MWSLKQDSPTAIECQTLKNVCEPAYQCMSRMWREVAPFQRKVEDSRFTDEVGRLLESVKNQPSIFREMKAPPDYRDIADLERTTVKLRGLDAIGAPYYRNEPTLVLRLAGDLRFCRDLFYRESTSYAVLNEAFQGVLAHTTQPLSVVSQPSGCSLAQIQNEIIFGNMHPFRIDFLSRMGEDWPLKAHKEAQNVQPERFFEQVIGLNYDRGFHPDYEREMIQYVATSADQFAATIMTLPLTQHDLFVDLGSGLGRLPILASLLTGAEAVGIEYQRCFCDAAHEYAENLHLNQVSFINDDFRNVDLAGASVVFAFDPCVGAMRNSLIEKLRKQARHKPLTVLALGQIGELLSNQSWIYSNPLNHPDEIQILRSR